MTRCNKIAPQVIIHEGEKEFLTGEKNFTHTSTPSLQLRAIVAMKLVPGEDYKASLFKDRKNLDFENQCTFQLLSMPITSKLTAMGSATCMGFNMRSGALMILGGRG